MFNTAVVKLDLPKRKNIRLKGYDYSQKGAYFITICTHNKQRLLGNVVGVGFHADPCKAPFVNLSPTGKEIEKSIQYINSNYTDISIISYVVMPNHIHMIILLEAGGHGNPPLQNVVGQFKSFVTKKYNILFDTKNIILWQRNYYEHIIRDEDDFLKIWQYIDENPAKWQDDCYFS